MKILICEDNPLAMKTLSIVLGREGYETDTAADGKEAIGLLQTNEYDLLVVDIHMPYHSGLELVKFLRSDLGKDTPVIVSVSVILKCNIRLESWASADIL